MLTIRPATYGLQSEAPEMEATTFRGYGIGVATLRLNKEIKMLPLTIKELKHKRDLAERDLLAAYEIRDDGREAHIDYWETAFRLAHIALIRVGGAVQFGTYDPIPDPQEDDPERHATG